MEDIVQIHCIASASEFQVQTDRQVNIKYFTNFLLFRVDCLNSINEIWNVSYVHDYRTNHVNFRSTLKKRVCDNSL